MPTLLGVLGRTLAKLFSCEDLPGRSRAGPKLRPKGQGYGVSLTSAVPRSSPGAVAAGDCGGGRNHRSLSIRRTRVKVVGRGCVGISGVEKTSKEVGHFVEVSSRRRQAGW